MQAAGPGRPQLANWQRRIRHEARMVAKMLWDGMFHRRTSLPCSRETLYAPRMGKRTWTLVPLPLAQLVMVIEPR